MKSLVFEDAVNAFFVLKNIKTKKKFAKICPQMPEICLFYVSGLLPGVPMAPLGPYGLGTMSIVYFDVFNGFLMSKNRNNKKKFAQIQPLMTEICP